MRKLLTYIYAYYDNKGMLLRQLEEWRSYPQYIKDNLAIIITDDCSSKQPITDLCQDFKASGLDLKIFAITKKVPWNWLACRNIGAYHAKTKWLLLTDMDHMIDKVDVEPLFSFLQSSRADDQLVYLFERVDAPDRSYYKPHDDSFMMTHKMYWRIGGYDEEFSGNYGTSGMYRKRAFDKSGGNQRLEIPLTRFPREVLADASTTEFVRKHPDNGPKLSAIRALKAAERRTDQVKTLSFPYESIDYKKETL